MISNHHMWCTIYNAPYFAQEITIAAIINGTIKYNHTGTVYFCICCVKNKAFFRERWRWSAALYHPGAVIAAFWPEILESDRRRLVGIAQPAKVQSSKVNSDWFSAITAPYNLHLLHFEDSFFERNIGVQMMRRYSASTAIWTTSPFALWCPASPSPCRNSSLMRNAHDTSSHPGWNWKTLDNASFMHYALISWFTK